MRHAYIMRLRACRILHASLLRFKRAVTSELQQSRPRVLTKRDLQLY